MNEPSMFEVIRRLDEVTRRLDTLTTTLEDRYVPRREYELRVGELEKDAKGQETFRRQVFGSLIVGAVLLLAQIVISLAGTPGVGS
ncbi:hypothetical protein [Nocardioides sp.]|uniref:hypothetical protein n=1 Tax=Nocardioides sp. TaxID=35761 RepID=UPI002C98A64B|nr:hypothetical protein [Nocardioides sp.]HXH77328.1 hypothetical protein [Nocardioides sp.]